MAVVVCVRINIINLIVRFMAEVIIMVIHSFTVTMVIINITVTSVVGNVSFLKPWRQSLWSIWKILKMRKGTFNSICFTY